MSPSIVSPWGGSSRRELASALCVATATMPVHRAIQPAQAAARSQEEASWLLSVARWRTRLRVSTPQRPPTSTPRTRRRHRLRAARSSGYLRRLRATAVATARPGSDVVPGCGNPALLMGLTHVVSMASCWPWYACNPLATISIRRPSVMGLAMFMFATATLRATQPLASRQILATAVATWRKLKASAGYIWRCLKIGGPKTKF